MRIGIFGGSFNPPHLGHLKAAEYALESLKLDRILMIPVCVAPHKDQHRKSPSPEQRLEMTRLTAASLDDRRIEVSDLELRRKGTSFTYETILEIKKKYPEAELVLLMGTDMFLTVQSWKNSEIILKNATLGVFYRGDSKEEERICFHKEALEKQGARVELVNNPIVLISSTQLRRMLVFRCAGPFLEKNTDEYILQYGLYDTERNYRNLPMEELENVVIGLLNPNRVNHVLGCRNTAVELARRWGADINDASRAGILHDITKALDGPLQLTLCREYGTLLDEFSAKNPKTLHALTGSMVAERIFGENAAVVDAIRHHTTGKANMNLLEKIVYVADYMEPNRDFPGVQKLRDLAFRNLDGALKLGLQMTLDLLEKQGREISPESREALDYLNGTL